MPNEKINLHSKQLITSVILVFLFVFVTVNNFIVFNQDNLIFTAHEIGRYGNAFEFNLRSDTPPLYHFTTYNFLRTLGDGLDVALITNHVLLFIFIIYNYKLGKLLFNRWIGIISTFLTTSIPLFFAMSRFYDYRFSGIALLPLIIYYMFKTDGFKNKKFTVVFTVLTVTLVHFTYSILNFIVPLLFLYLFWNRKKVYNNFKNVISMFSVFAVGSILTLYFFDSGEIAKKNRIRISFFRIF